MCSKRCTVFVFKLLELVLSIITGAGAIIIEIGSNTLGYLSCFVTVGISGMVCFLSLAFLFTYCKREAFSRPALLLAAGIGAFLFFALALHSGVKQFTAEKTTLLSFTMFVLCLVTALVLYIDALVTYCGGPYDSVRKKSRKPKERATSPKPTNTPKQERPRSPKQERPRTPKQERPRTPKQERPRSPKQERPRSPKPTAVKKSGQKPQGNL